MMKESPNEGKGPSRNEPTQQNSNGDTTKKYGDTTKKYGENDETKNLNHKRLFELVSKHYDTWSQVMSQKLKQEEQFSPFPEGEESGEGSKEESAAFNFSLLEALEKASNDFSDKFGLEEKTQSAEPNQDCSPPKPNYTYNNADEHNFLGEKILQMIKSNEFMLNSQSGRYLPPPRSAKREGFSLYDTKDEEGLHEGNTDGFDEYNDQDASDDDYDIREINDDQDNDLEYRYKYSPTHHIELELNPIAECDEHGYDGCECINYEETTGQRYDEDGPSCEFTFEYDHTGKLIPVYNNVEEKLRMMSLQTRTKNAGGKALPSISELNLTNETKKKKNKKKKKKGAGGGGAATAGATPHEPAPHQCLFCEYESIFGTKPRQMIKWYDQRSKLDAKRREEIKRKLASAKQKAIKKQSDTNPRNHE